MLSEAEVGYYGRQIALKSFGRQRQENLKATRVLLIGAGGLGCPIALYLASGGVGELIICDDDSVASNNLHRQIAYSGEDVGRPKASTLAQRLRSLNPFVTITVDEQRISAETLNEHLKGKSLVIDGSDNFGTRYLVADYCYRAEVPLLHASISMDIAQIALITKRSGYCYRCIFPEVPTCGGPAACSEAGVLGVMTGCVGTLAASEATRFLSGEKPVSEDQLLIYDRLRQQIRHLAVERNENCAFCTTESDIKPLTISCHEARRLISDGALLIDVSGADEFEEHHLDGAVNVPLSLIMNFNPDSHSNIVVYCKKGARSLSAAQTMRMRGFSDVFSVDGGIDALTKR